MESPPGIGTAEEPADQSEVQGKNGAIKREIDEKYSYAASLNSSRPSLIGDDVHVGIRQCGLGCSQES